jgi:glycosyltransferase involved in cell wall biosynthesis
VQRNQYLFFWKNFTDIDKLAANARRTFRARIRRAGVPGIGIRVEAKALLGAVQRLPQAIRRRLQRAKYIARSDEHVLQLIGSPADDFVQFSQLEFAKGAFSEYLGEGWYELEGAEGERFRWMSSRASVFLRAPSGTAVLEIKGMVPPLSSYRVRPVILTVSCFGHQKHFELEEGRLKVEWEISPLPAGFPVELRLSLNQTIESETDRRELGLIVDTIGFAPPGRRRDGRSLMPRRMALSSPAPNAAAYAAGRNILMVCAYLPARGTHGGANMMFNLIRSLSKKHRITVLSFYEHEAELKNVAELSQYCDKLEVIYRGQTFDVPNVFGVKPPDVIHEFHHARMARLVRRYLATKEFDILQCEFLYTGHLAGLDPNIPAVLTNHEVLSLAYQQKYERLRWGDRGKVRALVSWMRMLNYEEEVLRRLASVVVLTPREAEFLKRLLPGVPVYSHAMGVDCEYFSPMPEQADTQTVVFVGNFRHSPNVSAALWLLRDIWPRVHEQNPGAQLYVVGPFPDERMKEFDGKKNVTLTGWAEDVRQYLARATVVVAPVFEGAGMRTKVLEAWAMQKPVVGTSDSFEGLASESGDAACIADDAAQFGERICDLLKNPELARSMGQQARRHVEANFSWDAFADVYDRIYSEIVDRKGTAQCGRLASSRVSDVASAEELQEQR